MIIAPTLAEITAAREKLGDLVMTTPVLEWKSNVKDELLGASSRPFFKLELFQYGGSFKPRGALINMFDLSQEALAKGVTAVSAGNHAIAVGYAAQIMGTTAKVVMPKSANAFRVQRCKDLGTEVILVDNVAEAFAEVERIQKEEGKTFIHPFEGKRTTIGTATVGLEYCQQVPDLEAAILPIGGGGLAAGMATAIKAMNPNCKLYGVEPFGADSMSRSFASGKPESIEAVKTMADSLGAPFAMPYTFGVCQQFLERIVRVGDDELKRGMKLMFTELKLVAEPAAASSLAALLGPLKEELAGKKVGLIACGSNIDLDTFYKNIQS